MSFFEIPAWARTDPRTSGKKPDPVELAALIPAKPVIIAKRGRGRPRKYPLKGNP